MEENAAERQRDGVVSADLYNATLMLFVLLTVAYVRHPSQHKLFFHLLAQKRCGNLGQRHIGLGWVGIVFGSKHYDRAGNIACA